MSEGENVEVVDLEILMVSPTWPDMTPSAYLALLRFCYTLEGSLPTVDDFECVSHKESEQPPDEKGWIYGPLSMGGFAKDKKDMEREAISHFIVNVLSYQQHCPGEMLEAAGCFDCFPPAAGRQSFYIRWLLGTPTHFAHLRRRFHERDEALPPWRFVVAPCRGTPDVVSCIHPFPSAGRGRGGGAAAGSRGLPSEADVHQTIIQRHIEECLEKKMGESTKFAAYVLNPWRSSATPVERGSESFEKVWTNYQPYFRYVTRQPNGFIELPESVLMNRLTAEQRRVYHIMREGKKDEGSADEMSQLGLWLKRELERMRQRYHRFGYDTFDFIQVEKFYLPELLCFYARPPPPCSPSLFKAGRESAIGTTSSSPPSSSSSSSSTSLTVATTVSSASSSSSALAKVLASSAATDPDEPFSDRLLRDSVRLKPIDLLQKSTCVKIMHSLAEGERFRRSCTLLSNRKFTATGLPSRAQKEKDTVVLAIHIETPEWIPALYNLDTQFNWKLVHRHAEIASASADRPAAAGWSSPPPAEPEEWSHEGDGEYESKDGVRPMKTSPIFESKSEVLSSDGYMCLEGKRQVMCCIHKLAALFYYPYECFLPWEFEACSGPEHKMWPIWLQVVPEAYLPASVTSSSSSSPLSRSASGAGRGSGAARGRGRAKSKSTPKRKS